MTEHDFHFSSTHLENKITQIKSSTNIDLHNKEDQLNFIKECKESGLGKGPLKIGTISRYVGVLFQLAVELGDMPFRKTKKDDVKNAFMKISEGWSPGTKKRCAGYVKTFFKWLKGTDSLPRQVSSLKFGFPDRKKPKVVLDEHDVTRICQAARNLFELATFLLFYELGVRASELLSLRYKDIELELASDEPYGEAVIIEGKGGYSSGRVPLVCSLPVIDEWLKNFPIKGNDEAPLLPKYNPITKAWEHKPMSYDSLCRLLIRLCKRAGIDKKITSHTMRRSRATNLSYFGFTDEFLRPYFRWGKESLEPSTYVQFSNKHMKNSLLVFHGFKPKDDMKSPLTPVQCSKCKTYNLPFPTLVFQDRCRNCGFNYLHETKNNLSIEELIKVATISPATNTSNVGGNVNLIPVPIIIIPESMVPKFFQNCNFLDNRIFQNNQTTFQFLVKSTEVQQNNINSVESRAQPAGDTNDDVHSEQIKSKLLKEGVTL